MAAERRAVIGAKLPAPWNDTIFWSRWLPRKTSVALLSHTPSSRDGEALLATSRKVWAMNAVCGQPMSAVNPHEVFTGRANSVLRLLKSVDI